MGCAPEYGGLPSRSVNLQHMPSLTNNDHIRGASILNGGSARPFLTLVTSRLTLPSFKGVRCNRLRVNFRPSSDTPSIACSGILAVRCVWARAMPAKTECVSLSSITFLRLSFTRSASAEVWATKRSRTLGGVSANAYQHGQRDSLRVEQIRGKPIFRVFQRVTWWDVLSAINRVPMQDEPRWARSGCVT